MGFRNRTERELKALIDSAVTVSGGQMPMDILVTPEEEPRLRDLLKGRRGVKSLTLKVAESPEEFLPMMGKVPVWAD